MIPQEGARPFRDPANLQRLPPFGDRLRRDAPPVADGNVGLFADGIGKPGIDHNCLCPAPPADWPRDASVRQSDDRHLAADLVHHDVAVAELRRGVGAETEGDLELINGHVIDPDLQSRTSFHANRLPDTVNRP